MWEAFVVMIFGLPAFLWQVITKEEKRTLFDDLVLAIMIAIVIYILANIF
ncbi:MAG: hypothetical protein KBC12_01215 [Candidatus Pacebacteria bacterium]|nr:hypothetical protein [Candidatus Paceibacterota bacterium]